MAPVPRASHWSASCVTSGARAAAEISHWAEYDYVLINEDMDECLNEVRSILAAERLKRWRQAGLVSFVRDLVAGSPPQ